MIKPPAATARTAMTIPIPEKLKWMMCDKPLRTSHIPSKNEPILLDNFIETIPWFIDSTSTVPGENPGQGEQPALCIGQSPAHEPQYLSPFHLQFKLVDRNGFAEKVALKMGAPLFHEQL